MSIYNVRKQLNMTQAEFSSACGLSLRSIQAYEQGRKLTPSMVHLMSFNLSKFCVNHNTGIVVPYHCKSFDERCFCSAYLYFLNDLTK